MNKRDVQLLQLPGKHEKHQMRRQSLRKEVGERASEPLYCLLLLVLPTRDGARFIHFHLQRWLFNKATSPMILHNIIKLHFLSLFQIQKVKNCQFQC